MKFINRRLSNWKHRHYGEYALLVITILGFMSMWVPLSDLWTRISGTAMVFAVFGCFLVTRAHRYGALCEDCIGDMPLDGQAAAKRRKWMLSLFHKTVEPKRNVYVLTGCLYVLVGLSLLGNHFAGERSWQSGLPLTVVYVFLVSQMILSMGHRRLQPWCPWCHWDDHGDRTETPTPVVPENV
jgi:hypothetical protein